MLLKKSGFSEKEIEIYLALIQHGTSVASDIAEQAEMNRSTTYVILDSLLKRGLVTETERRGVKLFSPNKPEGLANYFEQMAQKYSEFAKHAHALSPLLAAKMQAHADSAKPSDNVYEHALDSLETIRSQAGATNQKKNLQHGAHPQAAKGSV